MSLMEYFYFIAHALYPLLVILVNSKSGTTEFGLISLEYHQI